MATTTVPGVSLSVAAARAEVLKARQLRPLALPISYSLGGRALALPARRRPVLVASAPSTPPEISDKVEKSIKAAEETCAEDAGSGECVAAWDEVEELSAAASHARDNLKANSDPLENYCKDNPATDECRTYDN